MENIFNEPRLCRVCGVGSDVNKFVIKNGKVYGKRCLKCVSRQNNDKLKSVLFSLIELIFLLLKNGLRYK